MNAHRNRRGTLSTQRVRRSVLAAAVVAGLFAQGSVFAQEAAAPHQQRPPLRKRNRARSPSWAR